MKKLLLFAFIAVFATVKLRAQCVFTCSNYAVSPISYSLFPAGAPIPTVSFIPTPDDGTLTVPIGFSFSFYCASYSNVNICSNGFMQFDYGTPIDFGSPPYSHPAQVFPDPTTPNGIVALNMNDFDAGAGGSISYTTVGTSPNRKFILTYDAVPIWYNALTNSPPSPVYNTGQIVLYETTNIIEIHTGNVGQSPNLGTQGIESIAGTLGATVPGRSNALWSGSNSAYRFAPYTPTPPSSITGTTSICAGVPVNYSTPFISSALSYSWSAPGNWTGTSTTTAFSATTGVSGNVQVVAVYTCGVSAPKTLFVNSIAAPNVAISVSPAIICSGQPVTIIPNGAASYTVQPGGFTSTTSFTLAPSATTTYTLFGTDVSNCVSFNNPGSMVTVNQSPVVTVNSGTTCAGQPFVMMPDGADSYMFSNGFPSVNPPAGVYEYTITGTNLNGCESVPAISSLTVSANPTITVLASKLIVCKNETTTITAGGASTYVWSNGATTAANTVTPGTTTTSYTVTGTSAEGCSKTNNITINVDFCTGVEELSNDEDPFAVFPNPTSGIFSLNTHEYVHVIIYDMQGKPVLQEYLPEGKHVIDLTKFDSGQYFIREISDSKARSAILIKQ